MKQTLETNLMPIREATENDIPFLSDLRRRSLSHWQKYTKEWIEKNIGNIRTPSKSPSLNEQMFVLLEGDLLVGFYKFVHHRCGTAQLVDLYVDLPHIRKRFGQRLWQDAVERSRALGASTLDIVSDPNAESFYLYQGAVRIGDKPSPADPNITLPTLRYKLSDSYPCPGSKPSQSSHDPPFGVQ